jgi:hypothetical protein
MTTTTEFEERIRRGLQAAGDALPDAALAPPPLPRPGPPHRPGGHRRSRRIAGLAAVAVVAAATAVVATVVTGDGDSRPAVRSSADTTAPPTTAPHVPRVTNGRGPGRAVVLDTELRTYGPDGAQTGTVDLSRFTDVQSASSDLDGGWVVCGGHTLTPEEQEAHLAALEEEMGGTLPPDISAPTFLDELVWFPAGGEPVVLTDPGSTSCFASSVHVVDSPEGATLVYQRMGGGIRLMGWDALVLATGEPRDLPIPDTDELLGWSVTNDRFLTHGPDGFHLYDLATGEELPMADIEAGNPSDVVLSGDGTSVAALTGSAVGPSEVAVWDTATGAERFREQLPLPTEGAELSFDGTTIAFGSAYEGNGPVTVVDLATRARHEIDAYGNLP